ncbi:MAG: MerR family transcriptional regulator [Mogibacterium sp.]|nr:MerR family transcriptional regulator [Mogibacterium sp.]
MTEGNRVSTEGLLKIGELAKQTDTSVTTLKYYIREGLIRPVVKTGRNMSWYDPSCIDTVNMIRMLQRERYYPLSVIRDLLEIETLRRPPEMALLDAIHKVDDKAEPKVFTREDALRLSGLDKDQVDALLRAGIISMSKKKRREVFTEEDLTVMKLVRRRLDAGIPLEQSVAALRIYDRALRNAAHEDIDSFVDLIMQPDLSAPDGAHMIRVSDQTLDEFVALRRKEYNRNYGKLYVEKLYRFLTQCDGVPAQLGKVFSRYGLKEAATICADAAAGVFPEDETTAVHLRMFLGSESGQKTDLITRITACQKSREFFSEDRSGDEAHSPEIRVLTGSLRCLWLTMAPEALHCEDIAEEAADVLRSALQEINYERSEQIYRDIMSVI